MYVQVYTKFEIAYTVGVLEMFQLNPGMDHQKAIKKLMRYLQRTKVLMPVYSSTNDLEIVLVHLLRFLGQ